ncbi:MULTISPECIES: EAL domain-containing protein [unclassified Achromobacter]|uniref:EAL domain-containing protein n=1 Tax=unclassified Achromobacter TaxID=2626865 RepID=UPI000B51C7D5|nr:MULTISPECIES: EAL domain-containing protein [unclassified Achromobacter]OWT77181.1 GGDEF-domain containing protein [Achromobacter sp. HZ28]OWT78062.1 GGDEF-domain containing protein [Achromobacter sp. HZ34]
MSLLRTTLLGIAAITALLLIGSQALSMYIAANAIDHVILALTVVVAGLCWAASAVVLLRWLDRRLLAEVSRRLRALGDPDAGAVPPLPPLREFANVNDALARASDLFRATAEEASARIESMQVELNLDAVTRLPNRRYFHNELRRALTLADSAGTGHVLMFRQRDLIEINRRMPRENADQWLRSLAHRLDQLLGRRHTPPYLLARLNGSDFALLMPATAPAQAQQAGEKLRLELRALRLALGEQRWCRWALAMDHYGPQDQASDLLARLDHALMRAESSDDDAIEHANGDNRGDNTGEHQWRDTLIAGLDQHRFSLDVQALRGASDTVLRNEATLVLHDAEAPAPVTATRFMPAAIRLGLSAECDIQAVRLGLDWLVSHQGQLAIRLALASLAQSNFLPRLGQLLRDRPTQTARLVLEIDAHGLADNYAAARTLCEVATDAGARVGVRRLSKNFAAMTRLHQLPISYVKMGGEFISEMTQSPGSRHLAASVSETARQLKIDAYAVDIPDGKTEVLLRELGIIPVWSDAAASVSV